MHFDQDLRHLQPVMIFFAGTLCDRGDWKWIDKFFQSYWDRARGFGRGRRLRPRPPRKALRVRGATNSAYFAAFADGVTTSPVVGSRINLPLLCAFVKSIMLWMELAIASYDPWPMRWPLSQLSSTKRMMEV